jgi:hypothetical protein
VIKDADEHGAAVLAVPMKATVKESADGQFVLQTIDRSRLWEIHTPQVRALVAWRGRSRRGLKPCCGGARTAVAPYASTPTPLFLEADGGRGRWCHVLCFDMLVYHVTCR